MRYASVCQARPIEEELDLLEKLHPVLLQHDDMRSLADLDLPRQQRWRNSSQVPLWPARRSASDCRTITLYDYTS
jgi:hypothetical protein